MTKSAAATWGAAALAGVVALAAVVLFARRAPEPPAVAAPVADTADVSSENPSGLLPDPDADAGDPACVVPPSVKKPAPIHYWRTFGALGDLPCVERSGRAMRTSELLGKFVVADCIFTSCAGICPAMSARMEQLQDAVKSMDDVRLLSIAVDPERDTPQALAVWADRYHADKDRWFFLRCEPPALQELVYDRLRLTRSRDDLFEHRSQFALIDRRGRVRGYFSPMEVPKWTERLLADLDTLRREPAR